MFPSSVVMIEYQIELLVLEKVWIHLQVTDGKSKETKVKIRFEFYNFEYGGL